MQHRGPASQGLPHGGHHRPPLCCLEGRASPGAHSEASACCPGSNSFVWCPVPGWSSKGWAIMGTLGTHPFPLSQPATCCSLQEDNSWVWWDTSSSLLGVLCPPGPHSASSPCSKCLPAMPEVAPARVPHLQPCHPLPIPPCSPAPLPSQALAAVQPRAPAGHCKHLTQPGPATRWALSPQRSLIEGTGWSQGRHLWLNPNGASSGMRHMLP